MIIGRSKKQVLIWVSVFVISHRCSVTASSWQDPSSSNRRPDPPAYHGSVPPPPRRNDDDGLYSASVYNNNQGDGGGFHDGKDDERRRPPDGEQAGSSSSYTPIHYQFRASEQDKQRPMGRDLPTDVPLTELDRQAMQMEDDDREFASARADVITTYIATKRGRALLTLSSGAVGAALGSFLGKSLMNSASPLNLVFFILFVTCTVLRNPYGELSRALGMTLILALQRTSSIRKRYPTWPHVKACLAAGPRMPTDYPMMQSVLSMALVGVLCGANLPLLPNWMGAMAGGASFAMITTLPTANGDLARSMGMRVVSLAEEVLYINSELKIMSKVAVVSGKIFDRCMILDRKHRIKDKIVAVCSWGYETVTRTAQKVQSDDAGRDDDYRRGDDRRRSDRDRDRRDEPRRGDDRREGERGRGDERRFDRDRDADRRNERGRDDDRRDEPRR